MKRVLLSGLLIVIGSLVMMAQAPLAFKYQAVVRDYSGNIIGNKPVNFRISILSDNSSGEIVFSEIHAKTTNQFGLVEMEIGGGTAVSGSFAGINWSENKYFINVEMDVDGGSSYQLFGTSQLLSVPYALNALKADFALSGDYNDLKNKPFLFDGKWESLSGKPDFVAVSLTGSYNDLSDRPVTDGSETKIAAGKNTSVSGTGTTQNPYKINSAPTHFAGELFGGGVIFYVDHTGEHGLIVSLTDISIEIWSNVYDSVGVAASSPWNGQTNTTAIINQAGHNKSAAKVCSDYTNSDYGTGIYSDWYLPAINELSLIYKNIYEVNKTLDTDKNSSSISLFYKPYWSSTENLNIYARNYAYFFNFETFENATYSKSNPLLVRAVRAF